MPGLRVGRARLADDAVCQRARTRLPTPEATAVRVAATLPPVDAVVAVDRLVRSGIVELAAVRSAAESLWPEIRLAVGTRATGTASPADREGPGPGSTG